MNKQEIEKAISNINYGLHYEDIGNMALITKFSASMAISALTQQLNNRWIPVSDRLPKQDEEVLVTDITGKVRLMWIVGDRFENLGNSVEIDFIIAWQPLPKPFSQPSTGTE